MFRVRLLAATAFALILFALTGASGDAATNSGFKLSVSTPALIGNATVVVTVRCPSGQSKCSGATLAYVPAEPNARVAAFRQGMLIAPAQPFSLGRGQSTTLRLLIPLSEVKAFRAARTVLIQTYTLAANPNTKRTASVFKSGPLNIAPGDRRLFNLHRLRLRLFNLQLKRKQNRLNLTVNCSGASAKAKASVYGGCEGIVEVFGGTLRGSAPKLQTIGGHLFLLRQNTTINISIGLVHRRLTQVGRFLAPYLAAYAIAADRLDILGAAQLAKLRFSSA